MKVLADFFCDLCGAEIPAGEPNYEFTIDLLAAPGHCHSECLTQRNAIVGQYNDTVTGLGLLLNPAIPSAQKVQQAMLVQTARSKPLKHLPGKDRTVEPPPKKARQPKQAARAKKKRKVKRGA